MAGVWNDGSLAAALDAILANADFATAKLRLFKNNFTPSNTSVIASFTEADFAGYAPIDLSAWGAAALFAHVAQAQNIATSFVITAGTQNIYGWYVTNAAGTKLLLSQRDPNAPVLLDGGGMNAYAVTLLVKAKDQAT